MTVHQKRYYDSSGERGPSDHDRPQPISFLTVGRDTEFLIALSGRGEWTKLAETLLLQALEEWGVGAKTAAGYGRLIRSTAVDQGPQAAAPSVATAHGPTLASRPRSPIVERLRSWLAQKDPPPGRTAAPTQRERLQELRERWLDDLLRQDRPAKDEAIALLKKHIKSEKLRLDLELLLDQLRR